MALSKLQQALVDAGKTGTLSNDVGAVVELFKLVGLDIAKILGNRSTDQNKKTPIKVLDVGCGTGHAIGEIILGYKEQQVAENLRLSIEGIGIDINPIRELCPEHAEVHQVEMIRGNASQLPLLSSSIDLCYSLISLMYVEDPLRAIGEIYRVLTEEAVAVIHVRQWMFSDPTFEHILSKTPGNKNFSHVKLSPHLDALVINKQKGNEFVGFPFEHTGSKKASYIFPYNSSPGLEFAYVNTYRSLT